LEVVPFFQLLCLLEYNQSLANMTLGLMGLDLRFSAKVPEHELWRSLAFLSEMP
jgi:hypothetical protein